MRKNIQWLGMLCMVVIIAAVAMSLQPALAGTAAEIDKEVDAALEKLYAQSPAAKDLSTIAKGILVFPDVYKAGFIVGGQYGEGALRKKGTTVGYYKTVAASYGLQAGIQSFGYALFFIKEEALEYLNKSKGWEIGVGPSLVVVDTGFASSLTSTTAKDDIYAFFFDQKGLMAGIGLQGAKITQINP
jgi:lipid-binding SYLF domain-containing protein